MKIRILGCGTSSGVPRIGGDWGLCDPGDNRNRRTRASILVEAAGVKVLVDTSPDLREQLLAAQTGAVDAVIWTHDHADHSHGIDDLRQLYHLSGGPVDGYARPETLVQLETRFAYAFHGRDGYPPTVAAKALPDRLELGLLVVSVVDQPHGNISSAGLRFEADGAAVGYSTDFNVMTDAMRAHFATLDLWIVDCLRRRTHPTHPSLPEVLAWTTELAPRRTVLTHLDQSMDYVTLKSELPEAVVPGFDGYTWSSDLE
jgi:phosphoribosyl 1,2-cyclic phosphate phosphodiesterase